MIKVLSKETIDKIAAGEVIERPASVVKELVENSIDAGAAAVTVEIKNGGIDLIRVTDNGSGIEGAEIRTAFLRHATGKITDADDLMKIHSLGFRGEALSSIAAVSRTELITKTKDSIAAIRYVIEGGREISYEEIGAPDGTTIIVRDLFMNVPARKKFLKTAATEASHIAELIEKLALSYPDRSMRFINNGQTKLYTSGNGKLEDIVYQIYGRDITDALISVDYHDAVFSMKGLIGKPEVSRANRNFENYYVNGRYIKSSIIAKAIEDAYEERMMQHQFPFAVLILELDPASIDVNVHPTKMEVRFSRPYEIYDLINRHIKTALNEAVLIPHARLDDEERRTAGAYTQKAGFAAPLSSVSRPSEPFETRQVLKEVFVPAKDNEPGTGQLSFECSDITLKSAPDYRLIGQVFATYWIIEYENKMYIVDQHAAHEKIFYERLLKQRRDNKITSQMMEPPIIITLTDTEANILNVEYDAFASAGYEIEHFGGNEYAVRAVPSELPSVNKAELLHEMIAEASENIGLYDIADKAICVLEKTASMACKAAIKGGQHISFEEAELLIGELLECDNPYCCPHGRPTMIEFTKSDLEKKFKRIV